MIELFDSWQFSEEWGELVKTSNLTITPLKTTWLDLKPRPLSDLLRALENRKALHIPATRAQHAIADQTPIESVLNKTPEPFVRFAHEGLFETRTKAETPPRRRIKLKAIEESDVSMVAYALEERDSTIEAFCRQLESRLGFDVGANAYATPARGKTLDRHWDDHDVILFQLRGRKTWTLRAPVIEMPLTNGHGKRTREILNVTLNPGDLLVIPSGVQHEGRALDQLSVHLTFGVFKVKRAHLVQTLLGSLLPRLAAETWFRAGADESDDIKAYLRHAERLLKRADLETAYALRRLRTRTGFPNPGKSIQFDSRKTYSPANRPYIVLRLPSQKLVRILTAHHEIRCDAHAYEVVTDLLNAKVRSRPQRKTRARASTSSDVNAVKEALVRAGLLQSSNSKPRSSRAQR